MVPRVKKLIDIEKLDLDCIEGSEKGIRIGASACQVAEVEVDPQTGKVKVLGVSAAHDVGLPINLDAVEGQIEGGMRWVLDTRLLKT